MGISKVIEILNANFENPNQNLNSENGFKFKEKFESANNKYKLDRAVLAISELLDSEIEQFCKNNKEQFQNLTHNLSNKIFESLQNGQICEIEYLYIYKIFKFSESKDPRFDIFLNSLENLLFSQHTSEVENILFLQVCSVAKILAHSADDGLSFFVENVCLLDMDCTQSNEIAQFIVENFGKLNASFALVQNAFKNALTKSLKINATLDSKRARSVFNWQLHCFWNVKEFFNNTAWLDMFECWQQIFYTFLQNSESSIDSDLQTALKWLDKAIYAQFFIYHMCGNCFQTQAQWKNFCEKIDKVAAKTYEKFAPFLETIAPQNAQMQQFSESKGLDSENKQVIAFLKDRIVENSPFKVEFSLFENLLKNPQFAQKYRIKIYNMGLIEKSFDDEKLIEQLQNLGVEVCQVARVENANVLYNSHLNKALMIWKAIKDDKAQIIISPNNGYGISDFLLCVRTANIQIYYSHGNFVYDLEQVDEKITHICNAQERVRHEDFDFVGVSVKMNEKFYNPALSAQQKAQILTIKEKMRADFGADVKILGTIGRLVKIDSKPYLQIIIKLLSKFKNCIYLACGAGNEVTIKNKISEICTQCGILDSEILMRFIFAGHIDANIYGHIIDFWPDSFPLEQGESRIEFAAKGGIYLTLSHETKEQRDSRISQFLSQNAQILSNFENLDSEILRNDQLVAFSTKQYESKAIEILNSNAQEFENLKIISLAQKQILDYVRAKQGAQMLLKTLEKLKKVKK